MLINLSSNGELDPAKFSNSFSEGMVIKPNSFVCLVSASVVEDLNNTVITVTANTPMAVRFDSMNVMWALINTVDTNYSINGFIDRLNEIFDGLIHTNRRFKAKFVPDTTGNGTGLFNLLCIVLY